MACCDQGRFLGCAKDLELESFLEPVERACDDMADALLPRRFPFDMNTAAEGLDGWMQGDGVGTEETPGTGNSLTGR